MKKLSAFILILVSLLLLAGCAALVPPPELKAEIPNLNIDSSKKRPINLAIIIPDPMAYVIFYEVPTTGYKRDLTAQYRKGGLQLERELSMVSSETISQAFRQVVILRDMPQVGQYDAVVELNIGKILMVLQSNRSWSTIIIDMTAEWNMSVLDSQNREVFNKKGISSGQSFDWFIFSPGDMVNKSSRALSVILGELAKEWGTTLYLLEALAGTGGKNQ